MLPAGAVELFHQARKAATFPSAWLATVDLDGSPRVRTVRVCGFNLQRHLIYTCCDRNSAKVEQLARDSRFELCLAALDDPVQLRLAGHMRPLEEGAVRDRFWTKVSSETRSRIYGSLDHLPPWNFTVLEGEIDRVDTLDLRPQVPRQSRYLLRAGEFREESSL
ncbi:MAG: pyridoxamine 5'-phosphate oxidase family protein [Vulcanimicrobiota bacterium]